MIIDQLIELIKAKKGTSIKQMAKEIGVSDVYIGKILKGKTIPSISNTEKILKYFGKNLIIKDNE